MNEHEQNYLTHDLELTVIIHALKMWRHYILGRRLVLMSDRSGLRYLFDQPNMNAWKSRWLAMISVFYFEIEYIKGKENRVADALSRRVHVIHITTMSSYGIDLQDRILQAGQQDDRYMKLMCRLQKGTGGQDVDYHLTTDGLVRFKDMIYVSNDSEIKKNILQ